MPRLVVLNGPPGIGKSTLARRYVAEHPTWVALEQDELSGTHEQGRERCVALARTHLTAGTDVLVPQFVARPAYLDRLAVLASQCRSAYVELVLLADLEVAERRFRARTDAPAAADDLTDYPQDYERLIQAMGGRNVRLVPAAGDADSTYRLLVAAVSGPA